MPLSIRPKFLSPCLAGVLCFCLLLLCSCAPQGTPPQQITQPNTSSEAPVASDEAHEAAKRTIQAYDDKYGAYEQRNLEQRDYRTEVSSAQKTTVLIYMCAGSLESEYGSATLDLIEMEQADNTEKANVVLQTGGTTSWQNDTMADGQTQRWHFENDGIHLVENRGLECMTEEKTFADFVSWGVSTYPADRYSIVLWDHGAGSMGGFGVDELFPDATSLSLDAIARSLSASAVSFDVVGFDACLMSSVESAWALEPVADYLVAAEIDEPERGWDYTKWLSAVANNPHLPSVSLCKTICDSYKSDMTSAYSEVSMSLCAWDLTKLPQLSRALDQISAQACLELERNPALLQTARTTASQPYFGQYHYNMIDIEKFAYAIDTSGVLADSLQKSIKEVIAASSSTADLRILGGAGIYLGNGPAMPEDAIAFKDPHELYPSIGFCRSWAAFTEQWNAVDLA